MTIDQLTTERDLDTAERIQYLETLVARLAGGMLDATYKISDVVDYLLEGGYSGYMPTGVDAHNQFVLRDFTHETVREFCWEHPDWFHAGIITNTGRLHLKLVGRGDDGFVLTEMGVDAVLNTFLPEGSDQ